MNAFVSDHMDGPDGPALFRHACRMGLEGTYRSGGRQGDDLTIRVLDFHLALPLPIPGAFVRAPRRRAALGRQVSVEG